MERIRRNGGLETMCPRMFPIAAIKLDLWCVKMVTYFHLLVPTPRLFVYLPVTLRVGGGVSD